MDESIVGRAVELARLRALIDGLPDAGGALLMRGEAGMGKTVLLAAARDHARRSGMTVVAATGLEAEAYLPYSGLYEALRPVLHLAGELAPPQRAALLAAFGEAELGRPPEPFLIALGALNLLVAASATAPVLVAVDDVQWLDDPSHEALAFVARRLGDAPVGMVAVLRDGHDAVLAAAGLAQLDVGALADPVARQLVERHGPHLGAAARERILRHAQGNALALVELPASQPADTTPVPGLPMPPITLSARLERTFAARLGDLPPEARDVLLVAAVDDGASLREILAASTLLGSGAATADAVAAAIAARLIRVDGGDVVFRHPLVRSGVVQAEPLPRRQAAHLALAEVLTDEPFRSVWHRAESILGKDDAVADALERHHLVGLRRGSVASAIAALERAADLTTDAGVRGRRLLLAAELAFGLGRADTVDALLAQAALTPLSELERARMEWLREIFNDGVPGDAARVLELCTIARRSAEQGDPALALDLLLGAALRCWWAHAGEEASAAVVAAANDLPAACGDDPRFVATLAVAEPNRQSARVRRALTAVVLETATDADQLRLLGMAAHAIGDPVLAIDLLERAEVRLRDQGRLGLLSHVITMAIGDRLEVGDLARARESSREGQQIARDTGQPIWDIGNLSQHAMLLGVLGEAESAHAAAARAEQLANGRSLNNLLACVQLARGIASCSQGAYDEAYGALRRVFDPDDVAFHPMERFHGLMYLAEAAAHCGEEDDARRIVADLERLDARIDSPMLTHQLLYARAVLAADDAAEELFRQALGHGLVRWPLLRARLELAYGSWLRRHRRVGESRNPLRNAHAALDAMGASAWAERAAVELRAAGSRAAEGPDRERHAALSPQEWEIATLAADGLSNREIGARLYLSPRTVGSHLYRIFPKLGVTSRAQLASRLATTDADAGRPA
ncbi:ATP-binding protein [Demequina soli]|uniref:ATP-binding protein n=1 Tax=Demequina soli TaxID=1638987 RepID=UPI0012DFF550|nr:helix-turn-helix transcriptional regulator [Demequina soli]